MRSWLGTLLTVLVIVAARPAHAQYFVRGERFGVPCGPQRMSVALDAAGNVYTAGHLCGTADFDPGPGTYYLTSSGVDPFVSKLDSAGNLGFAAVFGGPAANNDVAYSVAVDGSGNVYTVGLFEATTDFDPGPGTFNMTPTGFTSAFISKLSSTGSFVWARQLNSTISGSGYNEPYGVAVDAAGNVYVAGQFAGTTDFNPGAGTFTLTAPNPGYDVFVTKLDGAGNFVWARKMGGGANFESCAGLALDGSGNVITVGNFEGTSDFDPGPGTLNLTAAGGFDVFVSKLDSAGNFVWARRLGGPSPTYPMDDARAVAVDAGGNVLVAGQFFGTADFDPGPGTFNLTSAGTSDAFVAKLDGAGNFLWARQLGGPSSQAEIAYGVAGGPNGNVHTVGSFDGTADFDPGAGTQNLMSAGGLDAFVSILDAAGNYVWAGDLGGNCTGTSCECCTPGDNIATGVAVGANGFTYTVGSYRGRMDFDPGQGTVNLDSEGLGDSNFVSVLSPASITSAVPDGEWVGGTELTLHKLSESFVRFDWGAACGPSQIDYEIYEGLLGDFTSHVRRSCSTGGATTQNRSVNTGNRYYLVVPFNVNDGFEGSYGKNSLGVERPPATVPCKPQSLANCVP